MRYTGIKSTIAEWYIDCFLGKYMLKALHDICDIFENKGGRTVRIQTYLGSGWRVTS